MVSFPVLFVVLSSSVVQLRWSAAGKPEQSVVKLEALPPVEREQHDVQYARKVRSRGVRVAQLIDKLPGDGALVLAHFQNGMIVPLPDAKGLERLGAFVATSVWEDDAWTAPPPVYKPGAKDRDVRPIRFEGNKLMVKDRWHPDLKDSALAVFTPWMHVDALVALERTSREAYARLFPAGTTELERRGRELFEQRCRVCHGARGVGASFGWDLVDPIPLHTYRAPESLFLHVRYRASDAPEKGYLMPQLSDLTPADAKAVWQWMVLVATPAAR